jgi:hypothetical protein
MSGDVDGVVVATNLSNSGVGGHAAGVGVENCLAWVGELGLVLGLHGLEHRDRVLLHIVRDDVVFVAHQHEIVECGPFIVGHF